MSRIPPRRSLFGSFFRNDTSSLNQSRHRSPTITETLSSFFLGGAAASFAAEQPSSRDEAAARMTLLFQDEDDERMILEDNMVSQLKQLITSHKAVALRLKEESVWDAKSALTAKQEKMLYLYLFRKMMG